MQEELLNKIMGKVVEMDAYMRDQFSEMATKEELRAVRNEMVDYMDGFVKLHTHLDAEHLALCTRVDRVQNRLERVEKKVWPGI